MKELVPVPQVIHKQVSHLNMNSVLFTTQDGSTQLVPYEEFSHCERLDNVTICNSIISDSFIKLSRCVHGLISNNDDTFCEFKSLESKNYFMGISKYSFYCSIVDPILLRISCKGVNYVRNLRKSEILSYEVSSREATGKR